MSDFIPGLQMPYLDGDGKYVVSSVPSTPGWNMWITSAGDDLGPPVVRGGGALLQIAWTANEQRGEKSFEFQFAEPVQVHDGGATFDPAAWSTDDLLEYHVVMSATPTMVNGGGTGNCNVVPTGYGFNVIVPAAGNGGHDVDLTKAVPVPTAATDGYWDADYDTGKVTPSEKIGAARFNLYDLEFTTATVRRVIFFNTTGKFALDAYGVAWVHMNWKLRCLATKNSAGAGVISGYIRVFRRNGQI